MPFAPFIPLIAAGLNIAGNLIGANRQQKVNQRMVRQQNEYNSPLKQRERWMEAGYNPNLAYSQGNSGNQSSPASSANYQLAMADIGTKIQQAKLMESQANLTDQKVEESGVKQDLMKVQQSLLKANPYMKPEYVQALVVQLQSAATMKAQEADFMLSKTQDGATGVRWERGFLKLQRELDLLGQRFNLGSSDQQIKAEVLQSKEFQNALQKIQVEWMKDGDITPQHIYQGIMMLLSKMM